MNKTLLVVVIVAISGAIGYYALSGDPQTAEVLPAVSEATAPPAAAGKVPAVRHPIEATVSEKPLPALDGSDQRFGDALVQLVGGPSLPAFLYPDQMIRRLVVTVDNLPRRKLPMPMMPVGPASGSFMASRRDDQYVIAHGNAARYARYMDAVSAVDVTKAVDVYVRFYPLFQQAYQELGYPNGYFNDRLVEVLDHLLATPDVPATVGLVRPSVFFKFADSNIENLSAGQKIMIRMGGENALRVKTMLRDLRSEILARATLQSTAGGN